VYSFLWETSYRATEHHLPCGIIQYYLPLDTDERILHKFFFKIFFRFSLRSFQHTLSFLVFLI